jgi:SAM-dependent methyltransferase
VETPEWAPADVDLSRPNAARVYDYMLGGSHNFAIDREASARTLAMMPDAAIQAQANRSFMHRAVRYLTDAGVRQFLDIGSGIPTVGNVHEIAPDARVAYVDIEPVAVAHSRLILRGNPNTTVVQEDARRPTEILKHPQVRELLDFDQPVGVLIIAVLHYLSDEDDPHAVTATLHDALPPGSHLVIAHLTDESRPEEWAGLVELSRSAGTPVTPRSRERITSLFAGFELVEPGVVWGPQWRPEDPEAVERPELSNNLVGVGRLAA